MIVKILAGTLLIVGFAFVFVLAMRQRFTAHLDRLEAKVRKPGAAEGARSDLPPKVQALASGMGARVDGAPGFAVFEQSGQMWFAPGSKPMAFTANDFG